MENDSTWLRIAKMEIGQKEIPGDKHNPRIVEYGEAVDLEVSDDETPWCSIVMNWIFLKAGIKGTGKANARSWLKWGIKLIVPRPGCVVIFKRGNSTWKGHVAYWISETETQIYCLGGNQNNEFGYKYYNKSDLLGYRWPA